MLNDRGPFKSIRELIDSDAVSPATRRALIERLERQETRPLFFYAGNYKLLDRVCDILLGQTSAKLVNIALFIDDRLWQGLTDGWRFDHMPDDGTMYLNGLKGINETAQLLFAAEFIDLPSEKQTEVLKVIQNGTAKGAVWEKMSASTFFEEILAEATEVFYAHPAAQEEIGYTGMADVYGWKRIGLNETEDPGQKEK